MAINEFGIVAGIYRRSPTAGTLAVRWVDGVGEVLTLLAEGYANKTIATRLGISENTVKFHLNAIMTKLDAQSRTDAVVRAARVGWLTL